MKVNTRAIATKILYVLLAFIIAGGGFFAIPAGPAQAASPFAKLTNPTNLPAGSAYDVAFSDNAIYMAVAHATSPYVTLYKRSGATFTKLTFTATGLKQYGPRCCLQPWR